MNAYIESHRDRLPIEFRILGYSPRPWAPEDSMLIAAQMVKDLNHYPYADALDREKNLARLGPELTADLYVNSSWHDRPPTVARPSLRQNDDADKDDGIKTMKNETSEFPWVVLSPGNGERLRFAIGWSGCRHGNP